MSTKHNCKHEGRGRSNYPHRRGMYSHGHLAEIEGSTGLRARQLRRVEQTGHPWPRPSEVEADLEAA